MKDLRVIGNRSLNDMIIVDNAAYSFAFQIDNGLPIIPYYNDKEDRELKHLIEFMKAIAGVSNIREECRTRLKLHEYAEFTKAEDLLRNVYGFNS